MAVYPGDKNNLPYDVVVANLRLMLTITLDVVLSYLCDEDRKRRTKRTISPSGMVNVNTT